MALFNKPGVRFVVASLTPIPQLRARYRQSAHQEPISWSPLKKGISLLVVQEELTNHTNFWLHAQPDVAFHDAHLPFKTHMNWALDVMKGPKWTQGELTGDGTVIAMIDTGVDLSHCYFNGKPKEFVFSGDTSIGPLMKNQQFAYVKLSFIDEGLRVEETDFDDTPSGHGTHVAGTLVGNGCGAPPSKARLIVVDVDKGDKPHLTMPASIETLLETLYLAGARVFSNSWGSSSSAYSFTSMEVDQFAWNHPDAIVLFSAGNDGPGLSTIGSPATAKNVISIGASQNHHQSFIESRPEYFEDGVGTFSFRGNEENIAAFSSRGPTADGRQKPDFVAPGEYILSSRAHPSLNQSGLVYKRGTSMSNPLVARLVSQFQEYYKKTHNWKDPSSALAKTVLACMSHLLTGTSAQLYWYSKNNTVIGRSSRTHVHLEDQGWGRVSFEEAHLPLLLMKDDIPLISQESVSFCFEPTSDTELRIAISWLDPPVLPNSPTILLNDLDLKVMVSGQGPFLGNNKEDHLNNIEKVILDTKMGDLIEVFVRPNTILTSPDRVPKFSLSLFPSFVKEVPCPRKDPVPPACKVGETTGLLLNNTCYPPCGHHLYFTTQCQCHYDIPCPGGLQKCQAGAFLPCPQEKEKPRKLRAPKSPIRRTLHEAQLEPMGLWGMGWAAVLVISGAFFYMKRRSFK